LSLSTVGTLLASVQLDPQHVVRFYETEPGSIAVVETAPIGQPTSLTGHPSSFVEVFRALAPSTPVPEALAAADARCADKRRAAPAELPLAASEKGTAGSGPTLYNAADQAWAKANLCNEPNFHENVLQHCLQGWTFAISGSSSQGSFYDTYLDLGSEATASASTQISSEYCATLGLFDCGWHVGLNSSVPPGMFQHITWENTGDHFASQITGGGNATVTLADYLSWAGFVLGGN
jgi:hypothetical protein